MKKILTLIAVVLTSMALHATEPETMTQVTDDYNKKCPVVIAEGTTLVKVETTDDGVVFSHEVTAPLFENLAGIQSILHDSFVAELDSSPDASSQALISLCKAHKLSIIQRFVSPSGKTFDIVINPDEL